jgi:hypothetical protein
VATGEVTPRSAGDLGKGTAKSRWLGGVDAPTPADQLDRAKRIGEKISALHKARAVGAKGVVDVRVVEDAAFSGFLPAISDCLLIGFIRATETLGKNWSKHFDIGIDENSLI